MERRIIKPEGIRRNTKLVNEDGFCDEIINIRPNAGEWELMLNKEKKYELEARINGTYSMWYQHPVTAENLFIAYHTGQNTASPPVVYNEIVQIDAEDMSNDLVLLDLSDTDEVVSKIYHFGNALLIITDKNRYNLLYDVDNSDYTNLEHIQHGDYSFTSSGATEDTEDALVGYGAGNVTMESAISALKAKKDHLSDDGYFSGHTFFVVAFKTSNGDYIMPSEPYYCFVGMPNYSLFASSYLYLPHIKREVGGTAYSAQWRGLSKPVFNYYFTTEQLDIINSYSTIITDVCVFMSKPCPDKDELPFSDDLLLLGNVEEYLTPKVWMYPPNKHVLTTFESATQYYDVHKIPISELVNNNSITMTIDGLSAIETFISLPIDDFTHHTYFANVISEYNSRLHMGNIKTILTDGIGHGLYETDENVLYRKDWYIASGENYLEHLIPYDYPYTIHAIVKIQTETGIKTVIKKQNFVSYYSDDWSPPHLYLLLNPVLFYPDHRAISIQFVESEIIDGEWVHYALSLWDEKPFSNYNSRTFTSEPKLLKKHDYFNFAYHLPEAHAYRVPPDEGSSLDETVLTMRIFHYWDVELSYGSGDVVTVVPDNTTTDLNRVQVSKLNSFLLFPARNSYRVGRLTNEVVGLATQASPVSEGQFGMFPMYVFTTEGVFSLEQGTGEILYESIQPVSLLVCNNPDSVIPVDFGILFATDKGLMVLSGRQVAEISQIIEGKPNTFLEDNTYYKNAIGTGTENLTSLSTAISDGDFIDYIETAQIGYDQMNDEVIISDSDYGYSYIFSLKYKLWYKTTQTWEEFIVGYPHWLGKKGNVMYKLNQELKLGDIVSTDKKNSFLIVTQPIKFNDFSLKSIDRIVARLSADIYSNTFKYGFYLYGSLNGQDWALINGVQGSVSNIKYTDLLISKSRTTAKFYIIVLVGTASEATISHFEADILPKYTKKLR